MISQDKLSMYRHDGCDDEQFFGMINEIERLYAGIRATLARYERPDEPHNKDGGFPRPQLGWAMAQDLYELMEPAVDETDS